MVDNTVVDVENIPCARVFIHHQGQDISTVFSMLPDSMTVVACVTWHTLIYIEIM